jgi:hypothetical protein
MQPGQLTRLALFQEIRAHWRVLGASSIFRDPGYSYFSDLIGLAEAALTV